MQSDSLNEPGADPSNQPPSEAQLKPAAMLGTPPGVDPGTGASTAQKQPVGASEPMPPEPDSEENGNGV